jgi:putative tryptophan/tyrosine transport system substrate-binding protein
MKRILVIAAIAAVWFPSTTLAGQTQATAVARVGLLSDYEKFGPLASPSDWLESFRAGLRELGYVEGKNVVLEFRYANRDPEKLARMAAELAAMKVNVIVAASTTAAKAAKAATNTIPIVFWGAEPLSSGLVANLDHPGENLTGVTFDEDAQKEFLAQLKELVPGLNRVAILFNRGYAPVPGILKYAESGARESGLSPQLVEVAAPRDLPEAFAAMKREGSRAVLVLNHRMFFEDRATLATLAITNGIAVSTPYLPSAETGALISHEADFDQVWRRNAGYVDKILKGANPGDLPVQRLAAFRYAINLNTAKALGLTIPTLILNRAALVIPDSGKSSNQGLAPGSSDSGPEVDAVLARTEQLNQAFLHADMAALERIIADDCIQITQNGTKTKAEWLAPYKSGASRFESIKPPEWRRIRLYGDVAVVTSAADIVMIVQGERRPSRFFNTRTWAKRSGQWYLVLAQNSARTTAESTVSAEEEILRVEEQRRQAILHNDAAAMDRLLADEFIRTDYEGRTHDRADELSLYKDNRRQTQSWQASDVKVRVYSDAAVVTERVAAKDVLDGQPRNAEFRFTHVWAKRDGRWQLVARHGSHIPRPAQSASTPTNAISSPAANLKSVKSVNDAEQEVLALEEQMEALQRSNSAERTALWAEDMVYINNKGAVFDKARLAPAVPAGEVKIESLEVSERKIRVYGDVAVVTALEHMRASFHGRGLRDFVQRYTRVWTRRGGKWQMASFQATGVVPPQELAPGSTPVEPDDANHAQDEAAIRKIVADVEDAWNRRDVKAMTASAHLSDNYDHINVGGHWTSGHVQVEKAMTDYFQTHNPPPSVDTPVERIRFITPDVAIVVVRNVYSNDKRTWEALSTSVLHKKNGEWWNEAFQNTLVQSREEARAQAERASGPMAQTEPEVITPVNLKIDSSADVAAIRKMGADSVEAWNRRDAKAETAHATVNHDHINVIGEWRQGKAETEKAMTAALAATRNNISSSIAKIRFITPDVAIVVVRHQYTNDKETLKSISTSVLHKVNGEWWNEAFQNTYVRQSENSPLPTPREQRQ